MKNLVLMEKFQTVLELRKKQLECHSLMQGQKNGAFTLLPQVYYQYVTYFPTLT